MTLGRTFAVALVGLSGALVEVETDLSSALPGFVLIGLPDAALDLSPFRHVPDYPLEPLRAAPLVTLGLLAAALLVAGLVGFRRRDTDER